MDSDADAEIAGVMSAKFTRVLAGQGRVVGTKFRPGAFRPFVNRPVSDFSNRRLLLADVFGTRGRGLSRKVMAVESDLTGIAIIETFLRDFEPQVSEAMTLAGHVAARIASDRGVTKVDQLVGEFGVPLRQLQRIIKEYVGVSPKWIIQRYRLIEAAERMANGATVPWADLAADLGYSDQAHFIRDFKRFVGRTPAEYARRLATS